ncbi:hypothetical protein AAFN86_17150 [Roseomonas sp. CAU 1739]|uniref:hypothetical protein n=1 Tax=Roseomonas sp. CAU 1739 TaxID=3140364 RepID=UPI00325BC3AC
MRVLRMLGVAAQAEGIRLRREVGGTARRAGWIAGAAAFGVAAVATAHIAVIAQLTPQHGIAVAAGIVALGDLAIAGVLALMARRRVDPIAEEARALRETMLAAVTQRDPVRDAVALALRSGSGPLIGAITGQAVASWIKRQ